jgi:hypothetical protein
MNKTLSRRAYLNRCWSLSAAIAAGGLSSCAKEGTPYASCTDTRSLSETDMETRRSLAYVDQSTVANRACANCVIYIEPASPGQCGNCQLVKGQISASGYCNAWAAKAV